MHIVPQEEIEYGLSLLRESIGLYEERKGIPVEKSKKAMPFFRQDSRMLVGPEIGMYVIPLYEEPGEPAQSAEPSLVLELDYHRWASFACSRIIPCCPASMRRSLS